MIPFKRISKTALLASACFLAGGFYAQLSAVEAY